MLAPSGKRILLLERGDFLAREMDNWNPGAARGRKVHFPDTWYDSDGQPFQPQAAEWLYQVHGVRDEDPTERHY